MKEKPVSGEESLVIEAESSCGFPLRLREAMGGRSIREFASKASMSAGTLHNYLNDESLPTLDKLIALANTASVNLNWLATGRGPASIEKAADAADSNNVAARLDVKVLAEALECIESAINELGVTMTPEKKSTLTASIYDLFLEQQDQPLSREKVFRLIESAIA